jgi:L-2-hydroxyglutarate oxidase LhgO
LALQGREVIVIEKENAIGQGPKSPSALRCTAALYSPSNGIVDSHGLMLALQRDLENAGSMVALATRVKSVQLSKPGQPEAHTAVAQAATDREVNAASRRAGPQLLRLGCAVHSA